MHVTMSRGYFLSLFLICWAIPSWSLSVLGGRVSTSTPSAARRTTPPSEASGRPIVYTIAGSDSGGGAGIQADLHAIHSFGCHACSAITCLTAQNSVGVSEVHAPPAAFLQTQLETLLDDLPPAAVKIGMLGTKELAETVGDFLKKLKAVSEKKVWVVLDPVMISTSGHRLIQEEASDAMIQHVFPLVDVLTPNLYEAEALVGRKLTTIEEVEQGARDLLAMGVPAVLIKGGHTFSESSGTTPSSADSFAQDYFLSSESPADEPRLCDGDGGVWLRSPRYDTEHTHGTGCTLSSAMASALALGEQERGLVEGKRQGAISSIYAIDACCLAKAYVTAGIYDGVQLGQGPGPVAQTEFPSLYQHFPSVAISPTVDIPAFRPMKAFSQEGPTSSVNGPTLGRILPIVDTGDWIERLCQVPEGVTDVQLRVKDETDPDKILQIVKTSQALCEAAGIRLWINDHWQAAVEAGCFGVHVGQEDLDKCVRKGGLEAMQKANMALGISTHSFGELAAATGVKPSYISLGPVFATSSKKVQFDPQGLWTVRKWRELIDPAIPVVAIGGINDAETALRVREAGADCSAVISAVTKAEDTSTAVSELNDAML